MNERQIPNLSCWQGPIVCAPLSGGITNRNFLVRDGEESFAVRLCEPREFLGIDRRNERLAQSAACEAGVAPEVVYFKQGVLVSRFMEARTLAVEEFHNPQLLTRFAETLRNLHAARDQLTGEMLYFCPFQTVRTYAATADQLGAQLPDDIFNLLDASRRLLGEIRSFRPTLCHNDLLAANVMDDGSRLWLVDWEYAGIGNPLFDLAGLSANCRLSDELESHLLEAYAGAAEPRQLRELKILKTISLFREALWAVIQSIKSDLDFDYETYAQENFEAYRAARQSLDA